MSTIYYPSLKKQQQQLTSEVLHGQQNQHSQPVEDVMHGGATEGSAELARVHGVRQGDQGVGDRCADVGAHHDGDGRSYIQNCKQGTHHSVC